MPHICRQPNALSPAGSAFTPTASFSTQTGGVQTLASPVLVSPVNGASQQPLSVTLTWNGSTGATLYDLQVARDAGFTTLTAVSTGLTDVTVCGGVYVVLRSRVP